MTAERRQRQEPYRGGERRRQAHDYDSSRDYLPPRTLQAVGVALLVAAFVFWAVAGRESTLFVGAALSLISLGAYRAGRDVIRETRERGRRVPPDEEE